MPICMHVAFHSCLHSTIRSFLFSISVATNSRSNCLHGAEVNEWSYRVHGINFGWQRQKEETIAMYGIFGLESFPIP